MMCGITDPLGPLSARSSRASRHCRVRADLCRRSSVSILNTVSHGLYWNIFFPRSRACRAIRETSQGLFWAVAAAGTRSNLRTRLRKHSRNDLRNGSRARE
jgi:hypothetical protein